MSSSLSIRSLRSGEFVNFLALGSVIHKQQTQQNPFIKSNCCRRFVVVRNHLSLLPSHSKPSSSGDPALIHPFLAEIGKERRKSVDGDINTGAAALHLAIRCASGRSSLLLATPTFPHLRPKSILYSYSYLTELYHPMVCTHRPLGPPLCILQLLSVVQIS